ncbi:MAG: aminotransferase class I/II-fold pyridoxal phosphate-dependent enzyme [Gemmatimonadota bacterium]|jgi:cystathionine beta-lyase/cystathionine gamma-synthase
MKRDAGSPGPGRSTRAVHAGSGPRTPNAPVVNPVVPSATFYTEAVPEGEVKYTRYGTNPTHEALGKRLAALESAEAAIPLASGNAACMLSVLACVGAGDHVVAARSLYGGTLRILTRELPRLGIETTFVDLDGDWAAAFRPETRVVFVEVPVNPTLRVLDIRTLARLCRERGARLIVDATFATPINFRPLEHGADLVMHSGTKYLGGHSDVTAGVVAGTRELVAEVREKLISFGPVLDPHAVWLLERGIKTLDVRVGRQNANALALAERLAAHPAVTRVNYPGLDVHPDRARVRELFDGTGGMLSFEVRGGDEAALDVLARLELACVAPSLGSVETLVSMPRYTSHVALSREERHALGVGDGFIRVSVGIEDGRDLIEDFERALAPLAGGGPATPEKAGAP